MKKNILKLSLFAAGAVLSIGIASGLNAGSFEVKADSYGYSGGDGTQYDPFLISSLADLEHLADSVNSGSSETQKKFFKQTCDIGSEDGAKLTKPIGYHKDDAPFRGVYDGGNHNVWVDINFDAYAAGQGIGLFGYVYRYASDTKYNYSVKNINVYGEIKGQVNDLNGTSIGGVVGISQSTSSTAPAGIINCNNYATIDYKGTFSSFREIYPAGIVGRSLSATSIINCINYGTIKGTVEGNASAYIRGGGITGEVNGTTNIINCANLGKLDFTTVKTSMMGGIAGCPEGGGSPYMINIQNCYSNGDFKFTQTSGSGDKYCGGIIGYWNGNAADVVNNAYYIPSDVAPNGCGNVPSARDTSKMYSITEEQAKAEENVADSLIAKLNTNTAALENPFSNYWVKNAGEYPVPTTYSLSTQIAYNYVSEPAETNDFRIAFGIDVSKGYNKEMLMSGQSVGIKVYKNKSLALTLDMTNKTATKAGGESVGFYSKYDKDMLYFTLELGDLIATPSDAKVLYSFTTYKTAGEQTQEFFGTGWSFASLLNAYLNMPAYAHNASLLQCKADLGL